MEAQRALLDQLMGAERNLPPEEGAKLRHRWKSRQFCQYFLCGFCPYELFVNTKAGIGNCELEHDYSMQKSFSDEPMEVKKRNLVRFQRFLRSIMDDLDERIKRSKERCEKKQKEGDEPADTDERDLKLQELTLNIDGLLKSVEELADEGRVEESKELVAEIDRLNEEKRKLLSDETTLRIEAETRDRKLSVCEVCGSFLLGDELSIRIESHLEGRQHSGYITIREKLEELEKMKLEDLKSQSVSPPRKSRSRRRSKKRSESRSRRRSRRRSRSKRRSRDGGRRHKRRRH